MNENIMLTKMRNAGVPREVLSTTLSKEGYPELRHYVMKEAHDDKSLLYIHGPDASLPFYLVAKEMILTNRNVVCVRLVDVHTALSSDTDEANEFSAKLEEANVIAIDGFVDHGGRSEQFLTPYEMAYFTSWFIRCHQNGKSFILHGTVPLSGADKWYPASFLGYINKRSVIFKDGKK